MSYLDFERLDAIDAESFRSQKPYPWINPSGLLTRSGYERLIADLPDLSLFDEYFNVERKFGQQSHDRFNLEYEDGLALPEPWQRFIDELRGEHYRRFLVRLFGRGRFRLRFHWHFTPSGASVSPHCDSRRKLGSHIFYLNPEEEWQVGWGGGTVVLDDAGRFSKRSNPSFGDFASRTTARCVGNTSFLFHRRGNSWHGVEEICCPKDTMRRAFLIVLDDWGPVQRLLSGRRRKRVPSY
jgi:hypothetical protein